MDAERALPRIDALAGYVTVSRAAEQLQVNDARIRQLVLAGDLEAAQWGAKALMIPQRSLDNYLALHSGRPRRGPARGAGGRPPKKAPTETPAEEAARP